MARKNVGVVTGTMPGEGNEELLTMRSPVNMVPSQPKKNKGRRSFLSACFVFRTESMNMGSQQKVSQATGTSQYSSKLQEALDKFDTGSNDSQPVSHFYCFDGNVEKFLRFTIPREGVPLLEKLHSRYGDFTAECRLGNMAGSMFLKLLSAILLDICRVPLKDLDITRVYEWRDALKEVLATGFDVRFLLGHLRHMIVEFHNPPPEQELAELEATITKKEAELLELRARKDRLAVAYSSFGVGSCFDHILI
ncbi:uncharacterized protein LOC108995836 [Juglans regia]|uniref:Uncharacterized protein LOC108995836 n=1 Tax=Juglans regia TaxID=51240 RepID=A0A2I4F5T9_JUGRE|nr:uncharacterized protein LOC108995836 [Juglans regia]